jgi:hypothetical protein
MSLLTLYTSLSLSLCLEHFLSLSLSLSFGRSRLFVVSLSVI